MSGLGAVSHLGVGGLSSCGTNVLYWRMSFRTGPLSFEGKLLLLIAPIILNRFSMISDS